MTKKFDSISSTYNFFKDNGKMPGPAPFDSTTFRLTRLKGSKVRYSAADLPQACYIDNLLTTLAYLLLLCGSPADFRVCELRADGH